MLYGNIFQAEVIRPKGIINNVNIKTGLKYSGESRGNTTANTIVIE